MNKLLKLRPLAALLVTAMLAIPFNSCTDLEAEVYSDLTPENFPTGELDVIASFASCYTNLYGYQNHNGYMSSIEIASDEAMIPQRGNDWFDGGIWLRQHQHQYNPSEGHINSAWTFLYRGALQCNDVINLLNSEAGRAAVSEADRLQFIGELRSLRALFYFWLIDAFGDVPLVTGDEEAVDVQPTRTPRADIFNFIVSEVEDAKGSLSREVGQATYARFNYFGAEALLSRFYLNAEVMTGTARWAEAAAAAERAMDGPYELESDYHANFAPDNDQSFAGTSENMLVIPYDPILATGFNLPQMTLHYNSQATFGLEETPWNGYCSLQEFYESYDDNDLRKGEINNQTTPGNFLAGQQFDQNGDSIFDGNTPLFFNPEVNELFPNAERTAGVRIFKFHFPDGSAQNLPNDFPLIRYAEVLLNRAEALFRQNSGDAEALMLVNMVRNRAYGDEDNGYDSLNEDRLLAERGRELFFEGHRRTDLIRFDRYGDEWDFKPASDATKQIFPIPADQLNANRNLTQNPGY
ncbi:RagB/SusD family nutrient uptake outer membrane protein [Lewinellaceae bacterium SD302]|nr:RagB/SusD family nutrient uptake outer membrane protein [Lewinellaceae bacterium SD302]